jgi:uncharacterized membrane protein (UPF0127 family)
MGRRVAHLALVGGLVLAAGPLRAACQDDQVELRWPGGSARFTVEIADDVGERAQGLMMRDKMASSAGMLFVYDRPEHVSFWMKDTLLPLDMVFVGPDGAVTAVHSNAVPLDESPIDGGPGVQFVLEINGGLAERLGIAPGAEMRSPRVDQSRALWSCAAG